MTRDISLASLVGKFIPFMRKVSSGPNNDLLTLLLSNAITKGVKISMCTLEITNIQIIAVIFIKLLEKPRLLGVFRKRLFIPQDTEFSDGTFKEKNSLGNIDLLEDS